MKSTASEPGLSKVNLASLSAQVLSREIPSVLYRPARALQIMNAPH